MDLIFCKLQKTKNVCKLKKAHKTWIEFFASLKKLKNRGSNFLQDKKTKKYELNPSFSSKISMVIIL